MFLSIARKISGVLAATIVLLSLTVGVQAENNSYLPPAKAYEMVQAEKATLIDIRHPEEWRQTGIAKGALRVEMVAPQMATEFAQQVRKAVGGMTDAPIILICRTGHRTSLMQAALTQLGFKHVYQVYGGMMGRIGAPGWVATGLPVEPCPKC
ncbi:MAG: rhodanese-like domain-containing protein [Alphaproteobacteria bacterium]